MTDDQAVPATHPEEREEGLDEFRALVRAAFEQAANSGKPGWHEMTSAVLKNRLLNLTDRQFSEGRYGSPSFIHLVRRVPESLDVVDTDPPFRVRIKEPALRSSEPGSLAVSLAEPESHLEPQAAHGERNWRRTRVRDDLWRAIIDYDSGSVYVLDPQGVARPREVTDPDLPELPTATPGDLASWRRDFVESASVAYGQEALKGVNAWAESSGRQTDLPRFLRGQWAEFLKKSVVRRLQNWYQERGEEVPADLLLDAHTRNLPPAEAIEDVVRTRQLRDLIIRAVQTMNFEELSSIPLPAVVLLRLSGRTLDVDGRSPVN
ncbi:hypothetical protein [Micromonospora taraxaci]|uniref:hypothetical protein n=1 Tax=Micromonospora taraxaci TaxID=1316803 RepID=UPI003C2FD036